MSQRQPTKMTASEIAQAVACRSVSVSDVAEAHIQRIEATHDALNAVIWPMFDEAKAQAREADRVLADGEPTGRLFGVPITIKDQFLVKGTPTSFGLAHRSKTPIDKEGPLVERLRKQGAIILGKTNLPQLLVSYECEYVTKSVANGPMNAAVDCLDSHSGVSSSSESYYPTHPPIG